MPKINRNIPGPKFQNHSDIHNIEYNQPSGGSKTVDIGPHLIPVPTASGFTTNASTALPLPNKGACIWVYNNSSNLGTVTLGENNTITSLSAGATDSNGHVGIPCLPNQWNKIACGHQQWVITSASTLLVFLVEDFSSISIESQ
jgi:hypothetical protein